MDGIWTLPVVSTISPSDNIAIRELFFRLCPEFRKPLSDEFTIDLIRNLTSQLKRGHSYCPATWTGRANNLLRFGFPELALGDAYKAMLLLEHYDDPTSKLKHAVVKEIRRQTKENLQMVVYSSNTTNDRLTRTKQFIAHVSDRAALIIAQALFMCNCYIECFEFLKDYKPKKKPPSIRFEKLKEFSECAQTMEDISRLKDADYVHHLDKDAQEARRSGTIRPQIYPWSQPFTERGEGVLKLAKSNLSKASNLACYLEPSSVIRSIPSTMSLSDDKTEVLGIKVDRDCEAGETLLIDRTFLSGISHNPENHCACCRGSLSTDFPAENEAKCCETRFCCTDCKELANHYHFHLCRKPQDLTKVEEMMLDGCSVSPETIASNDLLYRILAYIENHPTTHPLRTSVIGTMTPAYKDGGEIRFSWTNDIKRPFAMLTMLGSDIFKDHAADTWVIQSIQARIRNNIRESTDDAGNCHVSINLLYMFFNHSCDPNVNVDLDWSKGNHVSIKAIRPIKRHEELFITYLADEDLDLSYSERQELLRDWTGGRCQCPKCQRERAESEETERTALPQPSFSILEDDIQDNDYRDEDRFRQELNRAAAEETNVTSHVTLCSLRRGRSLQNLSVAPVESDDTDCGESSQSRKRRKQLT